MKKLTILLSFLLLSLQGIAQPYQTIFGTNTTGWVFSWVWNWDKQPRSYIDTAFVAADTVVNGVAYKKITHSYYPFYQSLFREDLVNGKVWSRSISNGAVSASELLMFDFSLQPGDTFDLSYIKNTIYPGAVDTVDSVRVINGVKHIYFKSVYGFGEPLTFIEGIGSNAGPMSYGPLLLGPYLLCTYKDGQQTAYVNKYYNGDCHPPLGIQQPTKDKDITIYPNPATDRVYIDGNTIKIKIVAVDGRLVKELAQKPLKMIDIQDIPPGNYLLQLLADDGSTATQHLTIAR